MANVPPKPNAVATQGKIFIHPVLRTVDINTGAEGEKHQIITDDFSR